MLSVYHTFYESYTCYKLTTVAAILVDRELSLLNVCFQRHYREMTGYAGIVDTIKILYYRIYQLPLILTVLLHVA